MVSVYVPATSANIGAGFDCLGFALKMGNQVDMEEADGCEISVKVGPPVTAGPENLVFSAAKQLYQECGKPFSGLRLLQSNYIPLARGLGSSSACIVGGLMGANALLNSICTQSELLDIATGIEGHPDNVAPAILGGCVASVFDEGHVYSLKKDISSDLCFAVFIPEFTLLTSKARKALPTKVPLRDAVFNLSCASLCQAALCEGRKDLLPVAIRDRLHQPYRLPMVSGGEEIFTLAWRAGALATYLSGAGPTIIAVVEAGNDEFWQEAEAALKLAKESAMPEGRYALHRVLADNQGAKLL